jgi:hypothetical protein
VNRSPEFWSGIMPAAIAGGSATNAHAVIQMMQQDIAELAAALKPFANILPSTFFPQDGSEAEEYSAVLHHLSISPKPDFTGTDIGRARAVLAGKGIQRP